MVANIICGHARHNRRPDVMGPETRRKRSEGEKCGALNGQIGYPASEDYKQQQFETAIPSGTVRGSGCAGMY